MITVEPTPQNWEIYSQLCELDAEYSVCDADRRKDIVELANRLCKNLEVN